MANIIQTLISSEVTRIAINAILIVLVAVVLGIINHFYFKKIVRKSLLGLNRSERRTRITRMRFFKKILTYAISCAAAIWILFLIPGFRTFSVSLLAGAGIVAIILGFAAQKTISNLIAGVSIAFYTPFRIGDRIKLGEDFGDIEELSLRHTIIRTWDNRRIIIPNAIISDKEIINYSLKDERILQTLNMGISYDSDIDKARKIMLDLVNKHPDVISPFVKNEDGIVEKKEPHVRVTDCGDFAVNMRLYFWVAKPGKAWTTSFDLIEQIKKEFDKQGIEIPFPYRTLVYKKDLDKKKK